MNGRLPDRVVVFRDGVGNGQMPMVRDYEVPQLQRCFQEFCKWCVIFMLSAVISVSFAVFSSRLPTKVVSCDCTKESQHKAIVC